MLKSVIGAAFVAAIICLSSVGVASAQLPGAMSLPEIRQAIQNSGDIVIQKEQAVTGDTVMFLNYKGVQTAIVVSCPDEVADCTGVAFYTPYPASISASLDYLNSVNRSAKFGWLSIEQTARIALHHSLLLAGVSKDALLLNIRIYTAVYVMRGQSILENSGVNQISMTSKDKAHVIDAEHLPAPTIGATGDLSGLFKETDFNDDLEKVLDDAQRYGQMRKIANDFFE